MTTGNKFINLAANRLLGWQSFQTYLFDFMREENRYGFQQTYRQQGVFDDIGIVADGNDKFKLVDSGGGDWAGDMVAGLDGLGDLLNFHNRPTDVQDVQFENALGIDYYVACTKAELPGGLYINPLDGLPSWDYKEEVVGRSADPTAVVDNGDGTLTFTITSVTESGVDCKGRSVVVFRKVLPKGATTEAVAKETCVSVYSGGLNKITTVADLGQGASISTTASDYTVICLGPWVARNTDLSLDPDVCFIGVVTGAGAGAPPATFDTTGQNKFSIPLADLNDVTRYEAMSGTARLKIDVQVYAGDETADQIRITDAAGTDWPFRVTGEGDLEAIGDIDLGGPGKAIDVQGGLSWMRGDGGGRAFEVSSAGAFGIGANHPDAAFLFDCQGTMQAGGHITPATDDAANLGSATKEFKDLFLDGTATMDVMVLSVAAAEGIGSHFYPTVDDTYDVGGATRQFKDGYFDGTVNMDKLSLSGAAGEGVDSDLIPTIDADKDIGSVSYQFAAIYATAFYSTGIYYGGIITSTRIGATNPSFGLYDSTAGSDHKSCKFTSESDHFYGRTTNDLGTSTYDWLDLTYSGDEQVSRIKLQAATVVELYAPQVLPHSDGADDIGSFSFTAETGYKWDSIYAERHVAAAAYPLLELFTMGAAADQGGWFIGHDGANNYLHFGTFTDAEVLTPAFWLKRDGTVVFNVDLMPHSTSDTIGSSTTGWQDVYIKNLHVRHPGSAPAANYIDLEDAVETTNRQRWRIKDGGGNLVIGPTTGTSGLGTLEETLKFFRAAGDVATCDYAQLDTRLSIRSASEAMLDMWRKKASPGDGDGFRFYTGVDSIKFLRLATLDAVGAELDTIVTFFADEGSPESAIWNVSLVPQVTATFDVGASVYKWKDGWFSGTVVADYLRGETALRVGGDAGSGTAGYVTFTDSVSGVSTGVGTVRVNGTTARDSTGWLKFYDGTTAKYIPVFTTITG